MMMMTATKKPHLKCEKSPTQTAQDLQDNLLHYFAKKLQPSMECNHSIHLEITAKLSEKLKPPP
jgi:hypothetical protein